MATTPSIPDIINIAKVTRVLLDKANAEAIIWNKPLSNPMLLQQLWVLTKDIEDVYGYDANYSGLQNVADLLYGLCNPAAVYLITNGGSSVIPGGVGSLINNPIKITGSNFVDATNWDGANSDGVTIQSNYTLQVFYNEINRFLTEGVEWNRTLTGFTITIAGFDATTTNLNDIFYVFISA